MAKIEISEVVERLEDIAYQEIDNIKEKFGGGSIKIGRKPEHVHTDLIGYIEKL